MTKYEFLQALSDRLAGLPEQEIEERLNFYREMIDDRIEEGAAEEEAVAAIGSVDEAVRQILSDIPLTKLIQSTAKPKRRLTPTEMALLALGSPVWLSLLIAAAAVIFSLYVSLWAVMVSLWAVFASVVGCAFGGVVAGVFFAATDNVSSGLLLIAAGLICAGLSIFLSFGCRKATGGLVRLTKVMSVAIKRCFVRKGEAQ